MSNYRRHRGKQAESAMPDFKQEVLKRRYLFKGKNGTIIETPDEVFQRVAINMASVESKYGADKE